MSKLATIDNRAVFKAVMVAFIVGVAIGAGVGFVGFGLAVAGILTEDAVKNSIILHGFVFCLGLLPNVIGGYLAAMFAGRNELLHGLVAGIVLLAIDGLFYLFPDDDPFTLFEGLGLFLMVPLAVAGAAIQKRTG